MPRRTTQKKPQEVRIITHETLGISVTVCLDPNTVQFFAHYGAERVEAASFEEIETKVQALIESLTHLAWQPVIEVRPKERFFQQDAPTVGFSLARFYLARQSNGYLRASWEKEPHHRTEAREERAHPFVWHGADPFQVPCVQVPRHGRHHPEAYYLAHDEETWLSLLDLQQSLRHLRDHLAVHLGSLETPLALANTAALLRGLPLAPLTTTKLIC
ncbi:MAG: hypothetical protein H0T73_13525 [Ardenticatenales bacterium]|nr:hypothetical protein [Ardenticatenales bacterium]